MNPRNLIFFATVLVGMGLDQATKQWVVANLQVGIDEISIVPGWVSIVHAQNFGAAFSTLDGQLALFLVFTVVAVLVILDLFRRLPTESRFLPFCLGLILSGAHGNRRDRVLQGDVTDFIKVFTEVPALKGWLIESFGTNVWPIFNVADSSLLVGVALFALHYLAMGDEEPSAEVADSEVESATAP